ncbi:MAG: hypothetical protein ACHQKY_08165, partial [Terriglobia bacterium]
MKHVLFCMEAPMKRVAVTVFPCLVYFLICSLTHAESPSVQFLSGTVINTTNPSSPIIAPMKMTISKGVGVVSIEPPLYGSGPCTVTSFNKDTNEVKISSIGPIIRITWAGKVEGEKLKGTYEVENLAQRGLPEHGTFELLAGQGEMIKLADVIGGAKVKLDDKEYFLVRERDVLSLHNPDMTYAGRRIFLGRDDKPNIQVFDSISESLFYDANTKGLLISWHTDGKTGYYSRINGKIIQYLDRFLKPLQWESIEYEDGQRLFLKTVGDEVELYDKELKPLHIRSGKTDAGRLYWAKTDGDFTAYYGADFTPLNWYSLQRDGKTYYSTYDKKKKIHVYDSNLHELKSQKGPGFWTKVGYGLAIGLSAYGQAVLQQQAAQSASVYNATPPPPVTYGQNSYSANTYVSGPGLTTSTTTSTRIGNTTYSNTYTSTGET